MGASIRRASVKHNNLLRASVNQLPPLDSRQLTRLDSSQHTSNGDISSCRLDKNWASAPHHESNPAKPGKDIDQRVARGGRQKGVGHSQLFGVTFR